MSSHDAPPLGPPDRTFAFVLPTLTFLAVFAWALRPIWDIDLFWHIALGRWILEHGLPTTDLFSAADPTKPWHTFQGGYEVLVAWLDGVGGLGLVRLVHAATIAAGMTLLTRFARRLTGSTVVAVGFLALALVLYEDRIRVRPHVFNLLFIAALLPLVLGDWRERWPRHLLWLIPMMATWASFHGPASLWGVALLGAVAVANARDGRTWVQLGASALAMAVTPGVIVGITGALRVHTTGALQQRFVPEHWPLLAYLDGGLGPHGVIVPVLVFLLLAIGAFAVGRDVVRRGAPRGLTALTLVAAGMGTFSVLLARFAFYALVPLLRALASVHLPRRAALLASGLAIALLVTDSALYVVPRYRGIPRWQTDLHPGAFPVGAASVLDRADIRGEVYPDPAWGGYLLYRLYPNVTALTDGRIAFPPEVGELLDLDRPGRRAALLERASALYDIDLAVLRAPAFPGNAPRPNTWALLYSDPTAEVWARRDRALPARRASVGRIVLELQK